MFEQFFEKETHFVHLKYFELSKWNKPLSRFSTSCGPEAENFRALCTGEKGEGKARSFGRTGRAKRSQNRGKTHILCFYSKMERAGICEILWFVSFLAVSLCFGPSCWSHTWSGSTAGFAIPPVVDLIHPDHGIDASSFFLEKILCRRRKVLGEKCAAAYLLNLFINISIYNTSFCTLMFLKVSRLLPSVVNENSTAIKIGKPITLEQTNALGKIEASICHQFCGTWAKLSLCWPSDQSPQPLLLPGRKAFALQGSPVHRKSLCIESLWQGSHFHRIIPKFMCQARLVFAFENCACCDCCVVIGWMNFRVVTSHRAMELVENPFMERPIWLSNEYHCFFERLGDFMFP